jgi:hypothetical protein
MDADPNPNGAEDDGDDFSVPKPKEAVANPPPKAVDLDDEDSAWPFLETTTSEDLCFNAPNPPGAVPKPAPKNPPPPLAVTLPNPDPKAGAGSLADEEEASLTEANNPSPGAAVPPLVPPPPPEDHLPLALRIFRRPSTSSDAR